MKRHLFLILFFAAWCQVSLAQNEGNQSPSQYQRTEMPKIKVFPNPASHTVNVLGLANTSKALIVITDLFGNTILEYQWEIRNNAISLPISDLIPGIYMIHVRCESQQISVKFYKQ